MSETIFNPFTNNETVLFYIGDRFLNHNPEQLQVINFFTYINKLKIISHPLYKYNELLLLIILSKKQFNIIKNEYILCFDKKNMTFPLYFIFRDKEYIKEIIDAFAIIHKNIDLFKIINRKRSKTSILYN